MTELVSVGGVCFVAGTPEKARARTGTDLTDITDFTDGAGTELAGREDRALDVPARVSGVGKRKYRPRGERTRKEQQRAASRRYRLEHHAEVREYQRQYRERKRLENEALQRLS